METILTQVPNISVFLMKSVIYDTVEQILWIKTLIGDSVYYLKKPIIFTDYLGR